MKADEPSATCGLYIGLISGTSMDGVDAAIVKLDDREIETLATSTSSYPDELKEQLAQLLRDDALTSVHELAVLNVEIGRHFAHAAIDLMKSISIKPRDIRAIGSHGQTLRHHPLPPSPYSWQLGDGATIAALAGSTTVADFRSLDVACGGEGAPLVPPFHNWCFGSLNVERLIINLGGISNISVLRTGADAAGAGYDIGPGNCLMDEWCLRHQGLAYDANGAWAASGTVDDELLTAFLSDPYLALSPPKSTGREHYNLAFIERHLASVDKPQIAPCDVQATLAEFTVVALAQAITQGGYDRNAQIYVCGGGARNAHLLARLAHQLPTHHVATTATLGLEPDFVEAAAFAWLAQQRISGRAVPLSTYSVPRSLLLGAIHAPPTIT